MKIIEEIKLIFKIVMKKLELLVFVGNLEKLKIVVYYGVDVVFLGG